MKKMLAMLLAVLTLCFGAAAMAESVPEVDDAAEQAALTDLTANGQLIEGDGFQFYIPADWEAAELTDEAGSCRSVSDRDRDGSQRHFRRRVPRCG